VPFSQQKELIPESAPPEAIRRIIVLERKFRLLGKAKCPQCSSTGAQRPSLVHLLECGHEETFEVVLSKASRDLDDLHALLSASPRGLGLGRRLKRILRRSSYVSFGFSRAQAEEDLAAVGVVRGLLHRVENGDYTLDDLRAEVEYEPASGKETEKEELPRAETDRGVDGLSRQGQVTEAVSQIRKHGSAPQWEGLTFWFDFYEVSKKRRGRLQKAINRRRSEEIPEWLRDKREYDDEWRAMENELGFRRTPGKKGRWQYSQAFIQQSLSSLVRKPSEEKKLLKSSVPDTR